MFLRRLTSYCNCVLPQSHHTRCSTSSAAHSSHFFPGPSWLAVLGFPPSPPSVLHSVRYSLYTSIRVTMEQPDRGPSYKRRRSVEENSGPGGGGVKREQFQMGVEPVPDGASRRRAEQWTSDRVPPCHPTGSTSSKPKSSHRESPDKPQSKDQVAEKQERRSPDRTGHQEELSDSSVQSRLGLWSKQPEEQAAGASRWHSTRGTLAGITQQDIVRPVRPLLRRWETCPACSVDLQPPEDSKAFDFSVLCYNILSQDLLEDNLSLYWHCDPAILAWEYRLPRLLAEIQLYDADILCLQEVQEDHYEKQIKPALQAQGYQCEYKKRTGRKPDGCAIVFKSSRFSLLSSNPVEYFRSGDRLLNRDNVGQIVLLQPAGIAGHRDLPSFICVANTHLLFNPRRGDVKLAQLAILLAEISRLTGLPAGSHNPVVICGDLNSTPWSPLYNFLTTGHLQYEGMQIGMVSGQEDPPRGHDILMCPIWCQSLGINQKCQYENMGSATGVPCDVMVEDISGLNRCELQHSLKLQSSYQHMLKSDGRQEVTTCHSRGAMTVDYILFTPGDARFGGWILKQQRRLALVGQLEVQEVHGLPNSCHASDHLPLLTCFQLLK
ncbi:protein angel homolog 2 isoform X2 [Thalassophryne amazonica]|nr:protein angel homolog 2 isoform X2 [Thalassophryne amazonica]